MKTIVQKWGNSLGIRIPSVFAKQLNIKKGSYIEIIEDQGKLLCITFQLDTEYDSNCRL
jgi:antitoxin MazE